MAEAITRALGGERVDARSAGLNPLGWIADQTIRTLEARGIAADNLFSKGLCDIHVDDIDIVVSLLGQRGLDHIPVSAGADRQAWDIPDPYGEDEDFYFEVARQLDQRIRGLLAKEFKQELLSS
jgi:arsenate reductase